jgi:hypothetical protein
MQIDSSATIEDVPLTVIRTLFRRAGLVGALTAGFVRDTLHVSEPKAGALLRALVKTGFLKREKSGCWHLTTAGIRLRGSTAARPLLRRTAERLLNELLQCIAALNEDPRFLARVEKAIVFGSYLSGGDRLGDVDVAVHLVPRSVDLKKHREANDRRVAEEEQKGRRFRSFLDQTFWWEQEGMLFLRNRRRGLSLQHYGSIREAVEASSHTLIFPKPESTSTG